MCEETVGWWMEKTQIHTLCVCGVDLIKRARGGGGGGQITIWPEMFHLDALSPPPAQLVSPHFSQHTLATGIKDRLQKSVERGSAAVATRKKGGLCIAPGLFLEGYCLHGFVGGGGGSSSSLRRHRRSIQIPANGGSRRGGRSNVCGAFFYASSTRRGGIRGREGGRRALSTN